MAIDPRRLRPSEAVRLLNSTPLGEVINERQLLRHRSKAGFRIGDDRTLDLLRYTAWLALERHRPRPFLGADAVRPEAEVAQRVTRDQCETPARLDVAKFDGGQFGHLRPVVQPGRREQAGAWRHQCTKHRRCAEQQRTPHTAAAPPAHQ